MRLAPCSRSMACPLAISLLTSTSVILLTTPPHCKAYAAMLPTRPPPPMMHTFIRALFPSDRFVLSGGTLAPDFVELLAEGADASQRIDAGDRGCCREAATNQPNDLQQAIVVFQG